MISPQKTQTGAQAKPPSADPAPTSNPPPLCAPLRSLRPSVPPDPSPETLQLRIHGPAHLPTLIYLPGLHGDWTLVHAFRLALADRVRFVELTYPRTLTWTLDQYAAAIEQLLLTHGITHGWILAESFGSQIAWPLLHRSIPMQSPAAAPSTASTLQPLTPSTSPLPHPRFRPDGIILAGGFIKHPIPGGPRLAELLIRLLPWQFLLFLVHLYARYSRLRLRQPSPEALARLHEFLARRTEPDRLAILHRLRLITANDPRPLARAATLPVYQLTGWFDPIVPWPPVRTGLRRHCPGHRDTRVIPYADHTILCSAPLTAAEQVLAWIDAH